MNLRDWLGEEFGRSTKLARDLSAANPARQVPRAFVGQMAAAEGGKTRARPVPPRLAPAIERLTGGAVMRWDLRPDDWWEIWPELRLRRGSPDVPEFAQQVEVTA